MRITLAAFLVCCMVQTGLCADVGVHLESLDSIDRKIRVTYTPPSTSIYAETTYTDTVFCALDAQSAWFKRAIVLPMRRTDSMQYVVEAELPDSTYHLRIEICIPTDRVPEGIATYQILQEGGNAWVDSTVDSEKLRRLTANRQDDPLLYNYYLWNDYFYPVEVDGKYIVPQERFDSTFILAVAYPRSSLGEFWIERCNTQKITDTTALRTLINAWRTSWNVDALHSIAGKLLDEKGSIYDPETALWFTERAERSCREQIGFRSGEDIFGSMGRVDGIAATKVQALAALGQYASAKEIGLTALRSASQQYGRERIAKALVKIATKSGDSVLLTQIAALEKPAIKDFSYTTIDGVKGSINELRGKVVVLDFWFAGCVGCAAEHKSLNELAMKYAEKKDVVFLSVSLNDARTLQYYLSKKPLAFQTIPDGQDICDLNGVTAFPTHVILNKDGTTALWETGGSTLAVENLEIGMIMAMRR